MMNFLFRFFIGYKTVLVSDGNILRFVNLVSARDINIFDSSLTDEFYRFSLLTKDYKKILPLLQKSGCTISLIEKKGFPYILAPILKRKGLVFGVFVFAILLFISTFFIWDIEINGTERVEEQIVLDILAESEVGIGSLKSAINFEELQLKIALGNEDISVVGITTIGTKLVITIKESVQKPESLDDETPANLIASHSGTIVYLEILNGTREVAVGDSVDKGDLLVSGIYFDKGGNTTFRRAEGEVIAQTVREVETRVPLTVTKREYLEESIKYSLEIGGLELPLYFTFFIDYENCEIINEPSENSFLGVSVTKKTFKLFSDIEYTISEEEATETLYQKNMEQLQSLIGDAVIIEREEEIYKDGDELVLKGRYICHENIAQTREFFINNSTNY